MSNPSSASLSRLRPAATLLVLRDAAAGPEVLMLRRADRADDRMGGAWVFPGGAVDAGDRRLHARVHGSDDATISARLGVASGGLDFAMAAIRECFEESGLLITVDGDGRPVDPNALTADTRDAARAGDGAFEQLCSARGWLLDAARLGYFAHWVTPVGLPKRFDTRFFVTAAPTGQVARADGHETVEEAWLRPVDALKPDRGLKLLEITRQVLRWTATFASVADCLAQVAALRDIPRLMPRIATGRAGRRTILPDEPPYAEIGRLDPDGTRHDARHEIEPGVAVRLSPRIVRVTAPNPGMMTGPGTNSYLVGSGDAWAVIDPGPDDPRHIAALLAAAPGPIREIWVTHTHRDHSPGVARLRAATGAFVRGRPPLHPDGQDTGFRPDSEPRDGERLTIGDATLRVIHTPGHAANHLCWLLEAEKTLFTGDHVMQGSTVVVNPPDGDMSAYLASLESLLDEDLDWLAPGHGFLIGDPTAALRGLIRHRLAREAKVLAALQALGASGRSGLDALVRRVYDDVDPRRHEVARRSLLAHLQKLARDGVADESDAGWGVKSTRA